MTTTSGQRPGDRTSMPTGSATVVPPSSARSTPITRTRRTRMTIQRLDPWSVLRLAFLLSLAAAVITVVAGMLLWGLLAAGGVFVSVDDTLKLVLGSGSVTITQYFGFGRVLSVSLLIAAVDIVLITALATIAAFLFNVVAGMSGGLQVTVQEEL